jgi:hypothetical protein
VSDECQSGFDNSKRRFQSCAACWKFIIAAIEAEGERSATTRERNGLEITEHVVRRWLRRLWQQEFPRDFKDE